MAARSHYKTKVARSERQAARLVRRGWEVVSSTSSGTWVTGRRTAIILRRPKKGVSPVVGTVESVNMDERGVTVRGRFDPKKGEKR